MPEIVVLVTATVAIAIIVIVIVDLDPCYESKLEICSTRKNRYRNRYCTLPIPYEIEKECESLTNQ